MAGLSDIEWTDATWNPVAGCSVKSAGCTNCYAMRMAARLEAMNHSAYRGTTRKSGDRSVWTGRVNLVDSALDAPLSWRKPRFVFVNSMSDLFQEAVPFEFVDRVWSVMARARKHTFQILTKRPDRMANYLSQTAAEVLPNVWLGTSVEDAKVAYRINELRNCEATVRFISFEPLIGSVGAVDLQGVQWAIVGGESGPKARPMKPDWVEEIFEICQSQGTSFFFKQWGGVNKKKAGRSFKGRHWNNMPAITTT